MLTLFINTARYCSEILLLDEDKVYGKKMTRSSGRESEVLLKGIDQLLVKSGCKLENVNAVLIVLGPGSFTGLRIGLAVAQALSYGLGVPLLGISYFDLLRARLGDVRCPLVVPAGPEKWFYQRGKKIEIIDKLPKEFLGEEDVKLSLVKVVQMILQKKKYRRLKKAEPLYVHPPKITRKKEL